MIIHIASNPIVLLESFKHALELMRQGAYACVRVRPTGWMRWACVPYSL